MNTVTCDACMYVHVNNIFQNLVRFVIVRVRAATYSHKTWIRLESIYFLVSTSLALWYSVLWVWISNKMYWSHLIKNASTQNSKTIYNSICSLKILKTLKSWDLLSKVNLWNTSHSEHRRMYTNGNRRSMEIMVAVQIDRSWLWHATRPTQVQFKWTTLMKSQWSSNFRDERRLRRKASRRIGPKTTRKPPPDPFGWDIW